MGHSSATTILCVDDDRDNRESLAVILQLEGYHVLEAANGTEGLHLARSRPDLILLDVCLPDLTGFEVCRTIKADPSTAVIPVIQLSGQFVRGEDRVLGLEGGADAYLTKPVEPRELLAHVRALLRIHQAEQAARLAARQWQTTFDAVQDGICLLDQAGTIVRGNQAFARLFQLQPEQLAGRCYWDLQKQAGGTAGVPSDQDRWPRQREVAEVGLGQRWYRVTLDPTRNEQGQASGGVAVWADISHRKRLESQLIQSQKMEAVGHLAGGIAHDFNNLLTVINGFSELVQANLAATDPSQPLVQEIRKAGDRAASLTQQLLAFSRKQILQPRVLDLNQLIRDRATMLQLLVGDSVSLITSLDPDLGRIKADPGQLEQVLINLAVNARDAMPQGGRLTLATSSITLEAGALPSDSEVRPGPCVLLRVADTGHGMDRPTLERIFEPFFTTKEVGRGTGLGLATVYGIVKQSGGHIEVSSTVGTGTTFRLCFPALAPQRPAVTAPSAPAVLPVGRETVLLVEDDPGVRQLTAHMLTAQGYTVLEAGSGTEALQIAADQPQPVDLLVTDMIMPGLPGSLLAAQLQARWPRTRVLFLSGYTEDMVLRRGVLENAAPFLQKPFSQSAFLQKVREVLDARG